MFYIGVDPGTQGGVGVVDDAGSLIDYIRLSKSTVRDVFEFLEKYADGTKRAIIEKVGARPGEGRSSVFTFGRSLGKLEGLLCAVGIPLSEVTPQVWQKRMGCLSHGNKNVTRGRAETLWPNHHRWTQEEADACLIAAYCRMVHGGDGARWETH